MHRLRTLVRAALWFCPLSAVCLALGAAGIWPASEAAPTFGILCSRHTIEANFHEGPPPPAAPPQHPAAPIDTVPGMPPVVDPNNLYSKTAASDMSPAVAGALPRVYVPDLRSDDVYEIDLSTLEVVDRLKVGVMPQHVVPSYDLKTLWVTNNGRHGNEGSLTPINPKTGKPGMPVPVPDPYNMYFTPDGKSAIVVAERLKTLEFRNPKTMQPQDSLRTPRCPGIDHGDFSIDGSYAIFTCEFGDDLVKIDVVNHRVLGYLALPRGSSPQDIRISPDGKVFFVADMSYDGVFVIDGDAFKNIGFIHSGVGTHGLYPSRDGKRLYVTNRGTHINAGPPHGPGSVSVIDFATRKVVANWPIPGGGSPDMGGVSADGRDLWVSGRWDNVEYRINTKNGAVDTIPVGHEPHGSCVWPQPGRYSTGHTENLR